MPVVSGVNDTVGEITRISQFARHMPGVDTIHLLPYHSFGENKYALLGRPYPMGNLAQMSAHQIAPLADAVRAEGLTCVIGG